MKTYLKAIIVITVIALCSAVILSVLSDVLYVSDEDKDNAKLKKVYDCVIIERFTGNDLQDANKVDVKAISNESYGFVTGIYKCKDNTLIIKTRGIGGFSGGYVECYVAIGEDAIIKNVVVFDSKNQSFIGTIKQKWLNGEFNGKNTDKYLIIKTDVNPAAGATKSSTAVTNSVNMAMFYFNAINRKNDEDVEELNRINQEVYTAAKSDKVPIASGFDGGVKGNVKGVWKAKDGAIIVKARGNEGYENGSVDCYVAIKDGIIVNIVIESNVLQSLIGKYDKSFFDSNYIGNGSEANGIVAKATLTAKAIKNCVDTVFAYVTFEGGK
ncbi:MAG: hypothetical protein RR054_03235 [Clostridia bacterium]